MNSDDAAAVGSVTVLLNQLKDGLDAEACQRIYERYVKQLEWVARGKMAGIKRTTGDEEDVALTVMGQFFLAVRNGRFPKLNDRHDLWQVLLVVLERRVVDLRRRPCREVGESAVSPAGSESLGAAGIQGFPAGGATPDDLALLREQLQCRLQQLPKEKWRRVAMGKLEQRTNAEIAKLMDCSVRQVERILVQIRALWQDSPGPDA